MKKLSILAAMFGILFATASVAYAHNHKKDCKDMTPEQKAEKKQKRDGKKWENKSEEQKAAIKQKKEGCEKKKAGKKDSKKDGERTKKKGDKSKKTVTEEAPQKRKWFFGLF